MGASGRVVERASDGARVLAAALADLARLRSLAEKIAKGAEEEPASALLELATLEALLATFQGHPSKTMWVAREAASLAQREHAGATAADHVEAASRAARDQRWAAL